MSDKKNQSNYDLAGIFENNSNFPLAPLSPEFVAIASTRQVANTFVSDISGKITLSIIESINNWLKCTLKFCLEDLISFVVVLALLCWFKQLIKYIWCRINNIPIFIAKLFKGKIDFWFLSLAPCKKPCSKSSSSKSCSHCSKE